MHTAQTRGSVPERWPRGWVTNDCSRASQDQSVNDRAWPAGADQRPSSEMALSTQSRLLRTAATGRYPVPFMVKSKFCLVTVLFLHFFSEECRARWNSAVTPPLLFAYQLWVLGSSLQSTGPASRRARLTHPAELGIASGRKSCSFFCNRRRGRLSEHRRQAGG